MADDCLDVILGRLSLKAQVHWKGALVYRDGDGDVVLERPDFDPIILGEQMSDAEDAFKALLEHESEK